jgi:hypothetical protein
MKQNYLNALIIIIGICFCIIIFASCTTTHKGKCARFHKHNTNNPNAVLRW